MSLSVKHLYESCVSLYVKHLYESCVSLYVKYLYESCLCVCRCLLNICMRVGCVVIC